MKALLAHCRKIDFSCARARVGAIYFLVSAGEIVYVGQSLSVEQRIVGHARLGRIQFDQAFTFNVPELELGDYEGALIRFLRPPMNERAPIYTGRDNEILGLLGLPLHDDEDANERQWRADQYQPRPRAVRVGKHRQRADQTMSARTQQRDRVRRLWSVVDGMLHARVA